MKKWTILGLLATCLALAGLAHAIEPNLEAPSPEVADEPAASELSDPKPEVELRPEVALNETPVFRSSPPPPSCDPNGPNTCYYDWTWNDCGSGGMTCVCNGGWVWGPSGPFCTGGGTCDCT